MKNPETTTANMQPESEESEVKLNISIQKEDYSKGSNQEENGSNKTVEVEPANKEFVENVDLEQTYECQTPIKIIEEIVLVDEIFQEKEGISLENNATTKEEEEQEENDMKLTFEADQSPIKNEEEKSSNEEPKDNNKEEETSTVQIEDEMKNGLSEKEDRSSEVPTNNGSYSVDIVESTTSELSETSESTQSDTQKSKAKIDDTVNNDNPSFVSYDSSITLKKVQIRLNDCLKDNSHLLDPSKYKDVELRVSKFLTNDVSFAQALSKFSGRCRLKPYDHLREKRITPNSSLFVNTSNASENQGADSKVLRYSSLFSNSTPTNGGSFDRKHKLHEEEEEEETECSSAKRQKTDGNSSLLNRSASLFRSFYKPVMKVSTPNPASYNFEPSKLDISGIKDDDNAKVAESTESTKKWCVVM